MAQDDTLLHGIYDPSLVTLSIVLATLASYTALDLAGRVTVARGNARALWLVGGAFAMGTGIWSMHFVGMLAFSLPVRVLYEVWTVVWSYLPAVLASGIALFVVSRRALGVGPFVAGGILMGLGICAMHYTGMAAMRLPAATQYDAVLVVLSFAIAMVASFAGLWLAFHLRSEDQGVGIAKKVGGAVVMGCAIPSMHYTGMAAASFAAVGFPIEPAGSVIDISVLGGAAVITATFLILGLALVTSFVDRRLTAQTDEIRRTNERLTQEISDRARVEQALRENQARFRMLEDNLDEIAYILDKDGRHMYVSPSYERVSGRDPKKLIDDPTEWLKAVHPEDRERVWHAWSQRARLGEYQEEFRSTPTHGEVRWFLDRCLPVKDESGQITNSVGIVKDITELKQREQALREAVDLAQQANDRMRKDLEAAARVQKAFLPESQPQLDRASVAWVYRPCAELGGDSLNVFKLGASHIGMYVLDVSGHGVPASLLSVALSRVLTPRRDTACILTNASAPDGIGSIVSPAEVADRLNRMFLMDPQAKQFFTLAYGVLDTHLCQFRFVCAGHPGPVHISKGHSPVLCEARNVPIGMFEEECYEDSVIDLKPGDRLYLYSDGVLEAMNQNREIFDERGLISAIDEGRAKTLNASVDSLIQAVFTWTGGRQVHDDVSILAVEANETQ